MRLKPSELTKLRANIKMSQKRYHVAECRGCGWNLSARTLAELQSVGWRRTANPDPEYLCKTCATQITASITANASSVDPLNWPMVPGHHTDEAERFNELRLAPDNPFPKVGGRGPRHVQTSRPEQ